MEEEPFAGFANTRSSKMTRRSERTEACTCALFITVPVAEQTSSTFVQPAARIALAVSRAREYGTRGCQAASGSAGRAQLTSKN